MEEAAAGGSTTTVHTVSGRLEVRRGPPETAAEAEAPAMAALRSHVVGRIGSRNQTCTSHRIHSVRCYGTTKFFV